MKTREVQLKAIQVFSIEFPAGVYTPWDSDICTFTAQSSHAAPTQNPAVVPVLKC